VPAGSGLTRPPALIEARTRWHGESPPQLRQISSTGESHGTAMLADPPLDLSNATDRAQRVDLWLGQTGLDAGLLGMESL